MKVIDIPGAGRVEIEHLVLDYNGTLAEDGQLIVDVAILLEQLSRDIAVHVLTADTHGTVRHQLRDVPCTLEIIGADAQDQAKKGYVNMLGARVAAIGNGRNDVLMLEEAHLGIGLIQREGASSAIIPAADIICTSIIDALNLLLRPARLQATLRN